MKHLLMALLMGLVTVVVVFLAIIVSHKLLFNTPNNMVIAVSISLILGVVQAGNTYRQYKNKDSETDSK